MYDKIEDVPERVKEFYEEVQLERPTGNMVVDPDDGVEGQPKAEMETYTKVVEVAKPPHTDMTTLKIGIDNHSLRAVNGCEESRRIIDSLTEKLLDGLQWDWFERYKVWVALEPQPDDKAFYGVENPLLNEEIVFLQAMFNDRHGAWKWDEPAKPAPQTVQQYQVNNYRRFRRYASAELQNEMRHDDRVNGTNTEYEHNLAVKAYWPKL